MSHKIINYCLLTANLVAALCIGSYVVRKTKALEKREEICKTRERVGNNNFVQSENNETMIVLGRSIWDVNLDTDCLYPLKYMEYAKKKVLESTNPQVIEAWQKAAKTWEQAAHKWRRSVQNLKNDDEDSELEIDLEETADKLTAQMCFTPLRIENAQSASSSSLITAPEGGVLNERRCNLAQRYITLI